MQVDITQLVLILSCYIGETGAMLAANAALGPQNPICTVVSFPRCICNDASGRIVQSARWD